MWNRNFKVYNEDSDNRKPFVHMILLQVPLCFCCSICQGSNGKSVQIAMVLFDLVDCKPFLEDFLLDFIKSRNSLWTSNFCSHAVRTSSRVQLNLEEEFDLSIDFLVISMPRSHHPDFHLIHIFFLLLTTSTTMAAYNFENFMDFVRSLRSQHPGTLQNYLNPCLAGPINARPVG